jgi:hypothetical protein
MDEQPEQERQRVGLTINAPEKLSHGFQKQAQKTKQPQPKREQGDVAPISTAEHKEPHRSE